jgi:hypothetical protein
MNSAMNSAERETLRAIFEARGDAALEDPLFWQRVKTTALLARTPFEYSAPSEWDVARLALEMMDGNIFDDSMDRSRESDAAVKELLSLFRALTSRKGVRPARNMAEAVATMRVLKRVPLNEASKAAGMKAATLTRYVQRARKMAKDARLKQPGTLLRTVPKRS